MNNFKFRVWDTKLLKFIPWNCFINFDDPEYIIHQWTGMVDQNKKDIYKGDIIETQTLCHKNQIIDIIDFSNNGAFVLRESGYSFYDQIRPLRIIGNIFENPELIEKYDLFDDGL